MATSGACDACLTLPPVQAQYTPKGEYIELGGLKTYKTGPQSADTAIIIIYDVFGYSPQILQGADMLAHSTGGKKQYQTFMPDFLKGNLAQGSWFDGSAEGKEKVSKYFSESGPAHVGTAVERLHNVLAEIRKANSSLTKYAMLGYCWGGKIVSMAATEGTAFHAAAEVHPSLMDANDGKNVKIPILIMPSKDEDPALMKAFIDNVTVPKLLETYNEMPHGWMAARGDLQNEPGKRNFERGYEQVLNFFESHFTATGPKEEETSAPQKFWNPMLAGLRG